jgi:hypothetical protein
LAAALFGSLRNWGHDFGLWWAGEWAYCTSAATMWSIWMGRLMPDDQDSRAAVLDMAANSNSLDLSIFFRPGDVQELRCLGKKKSVQSGYFKDIKKLANVISVVDKTGDQKGIYFVLNKINPALYARMPDTLSQPRDEIKTTEDADIERRYWLPVDFDPIRPAEISSSDEEHDAALAKAKECREWLRERQWPDPVYADSGNGAHLVYPIDLPNNEKTRDMIEQLLEALAAQFNNNKVTIDKKNFNAARIWKAYGTVARKGANVPERPWRRSAILDVPDKIVPVPEELLADLAWSYKQDHADVEQNCAGTSHIDDLEHWLTDHKITWSKTKPAKNGGTTYVLDECPSCHNTDACCHVSTYPPPKNGFHAACKHNHCGIRHWSDFRKKIEPDYVPYAERASDNGREEYNAPPISEMSEEDFKRSPKTFNPKLDLHLEANNFLSNYIEYAKTASDAYEEYHFASGLVLLSVAVDRQIVVSMRHGDIYPNIWIFPIGDSTISRKTTAYKLCKLIVKSKFPKKSLPSSFSPEALMDAIASTPRCYYLKDEAGSLLASLCKDYMAETRDFLAEIYECDDYYRKLKKSECEIIDPYITQLLMTTPDNLKEYTSPLDLTSGWLLRYLWMYPNYPKEWKPFAEKDGADFDRYATIYGEYNLVVEKLSNFRRLYMTSEAMDYFQAWQQAVEEKAMDEADNITKALAGRLMTHAIKMAALFTVGREDFDVNSKIELPHVQEACRLVVEYFLPIGKKIIDEVARAESQNVQDKIIGTAKRFNGRITQRDLLRALHLKVKDVDDALDALILSEELQRVAIKSGKGIKVCYVLTKLENRECHSDNVSHQEVYKSKSKEKNNADPNNHLYTSSRDSKTLCHMGQHLGLRKKEPFSEEYLDSVLTCRRIKNAISSGITDPVKLSEAVGIPVCIAAKWPGVNRIAAEAVLGQIADHRRGLHFSKKSETIVCTVCGADLAGHSKIEKNGQFYCAQPGCGYPKRGEVVSI